MVGLRLLRSEALKSRIKIACLIGSKRRELVRPIKIALINSGALSAQRYNQPICEMGFWHRCMGYKARRCLCWTTECFDRCATHYREHIGAEGCAGGQTAAHSWRGHRCVFPPPATRQRGPSSGGRGAASLLLRHREKNFAVTRIVSYHQNTRYDTIRSPYG